MRLAINISLQEREGASGQRNRLEEGIKRTGWIPSRRSTNSTTCLASNSIDTRFSGKSNRCGFRRGDEGRCCRTESEPWTRKSPDCDALRADRPSRPGCSHGTSIRPMFRKKCSSGEKQRVHPVSVIDIRGAAATQIGAFRARHSSFMPVSLTPRVYPEAMVAERGVLAGSRSNGAARTLHLIHSQLSIAACSPYSPLTAGCERLRMKSCSGRAPRRRFLCLGKPSL
jgi:hypothetical protein